MKSWAVLLAAILLICTWIVRDLFVMSEPRLARKPFSAFPLHINGRWEGKNIPMKQANIHKLNADDYMLRIYSSQKASERAQEAGKRTLDQTQRIVGKARPVYTGISENLPVSFHVAYYKTQHTDSAYHSPKSCLPGTGWQIIDAEYVWIQMPKKNPMRVNVVLIQKGLEQQLVFYWYQDRGRVIANEYWAKAYLIWDAAMLGRRDGALIRIMVPVMTTRENALNQGRAFVRDVIPFLDEYIPV